MDFLDWFSMHWQEQLGFAAAAMVLLTFYVQSMITLRSVAIASNVLFIAYGLSSALLPIVVLHSLLLPLNIVRLAQAAQKVPPPASDDPPSIELGTPRARGVPSPPGNLGRDQP